MKKDLPSPHNQQIDRVYKQKHYFTCGQMEEFITVSVRDFCCIFEALNDIISWSL